MSKRKPDQALQFEEFESAHLIEEREYGDNDLRRAAQRILSEEKPWRTLVAIEEVDEENRLVTVVVPAFDPHELIDLEFEGFPPIILDSIRTGKKYLYAHVNIGAEDVMDLSFSKWEMPEETVELMMRHAMPAQKPLKKKNKLKRLQEPEPDTWGYHLRTLLVDNVNYTLVKMAAIILTTSIAGFVSSVPVMSFIVAFLIGVIIGLVLIHWRKIGLEEFNKYRRK